MNSEKIKEVEDILRRIHLGACYNFEEMALQIHAIYRKNADPHQLRAGSGKRQQEPAL